MIDNDRGASSSLQKALNLSVKLLFQLSISDVQRSDDQKSRNQRSGAVKNLSSFEAKFRFAFLEIIGAERLKI
jgi:hypothetical protein